ATRAGFEIGAEPTGRTGRAAARPVLRAFEPRALLEADQHFQDGLDGRAGGVQSKGSEVADGVSAQLASEGPMEFGIFNSLYMPHQLSDLDPEHAEANRLRDEVAWTVAADRAGFKYT